MLCWLPHQQHYHENLRHLAKKLPSLHEGKFCVDFVFLNIGGAQAVATRKRSSCDMVIPAIGVTEYKVVRGEIGVESAAAQQPVPLQMRRINQDSSVTALICSPEAA